MKNIDSNTHVRGESVYVDDIIPLKSTLSAIVLGSPVAKAQLHGIDTSAAEQLDGVIKIITSNDIPGDNEIGGIIEDEPLLADEELHFKGQPIALILAESELIGRKARKLIELNYTEEEPIVDPREAYHHGEVIIPPRTFHMGEIEKNWDNCDVIVEDQVSVGGQEHLYLETQGAYTFIDEGDNLRVISSTQGPTAVQRTIARILNLPMHKIEVDVRRLGGGFGGKEDQATPWACMAALGTYLTKKPVKLILSRHDDMYMTGKRHPYEADFKIGLDNQGKILCYEVVFYQNAGAAADLSPAVLERTLFHATNAYFIPHVKATGISCRTNLPPNTAFRGFGGPQGMFVIESAISKAAQVLNKSTWELQELNLIKSGQSFPYGQSLTNDNLVSCWDDAKDRYDLNQKVTRIKDYNANSAHSKKGIALMPICFGISFTNSTLNQAGALVHIYQDGSIGVSTGAVEMGQGVNTRLLQVPMEVFDLPESYIMINSTNTSRVANTSPSAASSTHDLNGKATEKACLELKSRLLNYAGNLLKENPDELHFQDKLVYHNSKPTALTWNELVKEAYLARIDLSEHGFYATPEIYFDKNVEKGKPFAYHSFGVAIIEVTVDCIRGTYVFDKVQVSHDFGESMNKMIDLGQMEGGIVQGLGWMTTEELRYDTKGVLLSNTLSTYKIPDWHSSPRQIDTHFLDNSTNDFGLFKSKAIGEPPLMYGIGGYFAIKYAVDAFNDNKPHRFVSPYTPERVLNTLYPSFNSDKKVISKADVLTDDSK